MFHNTVKQLKAKCEIMAINLSIVQRPNPMDKTAPRKYYVSTQSAGEVDLEKMSEIISEKCTLTEADVLAVLTALTKEMTTNLLEGKIVRFGTFGSFQLGVSSNGVATEEEATRSLVKGLRVKFRPGRRVQDNLLQVKYSLSTK